jgi:NTE family protein
MRVALVLAGGGARGAYEAGVLAHLFEKVWPRLRPGFEFQIVSGTSVGAIHAAYVAASAHQPPATRARRLVDTWRSMEVRRVIDVSALDLLGFPLRALGLTKLRRRGRGVLGGLVDVAPLERMVAGRIPWDHLRENLDAAEPRALCVSCIEVRSGRVTVFMDGRLADPHPWSFDPNAQALPVHITARHVRASAAIPFLFPAVRIGDRYYVDGGLRMNTPLSPALRLRADRVLVVGLKHPEHPSLKHAPYREEVITQPAFLLGKVLNALTLDQLEVELRQLELVNALLERGLDVYGPRFLEEMNVAVSARRGVGYRKVETVVVRPSEDVGFLAARCYRREGGRVAMGALPALLTRLAMAGVPEDEADLLSYLLFDRSFTGELVELGRADAAAREEDIVALLEGSEASPAAGPASTGADPAK